MEDVSFYCVLIFSFCYARNYILLRIEGLYTSIIRVGLKCRKIFSSFVFLKETELISIKFLGNNFYEISEF